MIVDIGQIKINFAIRFLRLLSEGIKREIAFYYATTDFVEILSRRI